MATSNSAITFKGQPIEVTGNELKVGDSLPDFVLIGTDMADITVNSFPNKVLVISSIPSVDTPICSIQTKRFNQEVDALGDSAVVLTVSRDLPFAQKRWCGAEGVERVVCASDYKHRVFGEAFGVEMPSLGILARAIFVADPSGKITYIEYVDEIGQEPDYDAALAAAKAAIA